MRQVDAGDVDDDLPRGFVPMHAHGQATSKIRDLDRAHARARRSSMTQRKRRTWSSCRGVEMRRHKADAGWRERRTDRWEDPGKHSSRQLGWANASEASLP